MSVKVVLSKVRAASVAAACLTILVARTPLAAFSDPPPAAKALRNLNIMPGCPLPRIPGLAHRIFGSAAVFHGSLSMPRAGGGTQGTVECHFIRSTEQLILRLTVSDGAEEIFHSSTGGNQGFVHRRNGSVQIAERAGYVEGYLADKVAVVRWEVLPQGKNNPAVPGARLEPLLMALICDGKAAC